MRVKSVITMGYRPAPITATLPPLDSRFRGNDDKERQLAENSRFILDGLLAAGASRSRRASSRNCFDQLIDARFGRHPLGDHRGDSLEAKAMLDPGCGPPR
jgi:hypothetical protein